MKNGNLLRRLYKLADAGNASAGLGKILDCYEELLLANNDQCLTERVASVLSLEASNCPLPAHCFINEMRFETHVAGFGLSRRELALSMLSNSEVDDDALDLYNARMSRFVIGNSAHVSN